MAAQSRPVLQFTHRGVSMKWSDKRHRYEGKVTIAKRSDGTYDRKNAYGKDRAEAKVEIERLQTLADKKIPVAAGRTPTVEKFFLRWIQEIAPTLDKPLDPNTARSYLSEMRLHIFPVIGRVQLDDLAVAHLDSLYLALKRKPKMSPGHLLKIHAIIRRALALAMERDLVHRNVAAMRANPGSTKGRRQKPLTTAQARAVIAVIRRSDTGLRWMVGLALGPRQGEALGLTWECVDLDAGTVSIDWQLQRRIWEHGCKDPVACAAKHCRRERCTPSWVHGCGDESACYSQPFRCPGRVRGRTCPRHRLDCPEPCPPGCVRHAARCKDKRGGGLVMVRPKTFAEADDDEVGADAVKLPPTLVRGLKRHRARQEARAQQLGDLYEDNGLVFCQVDGKPIDPRHDLADWHRILTAAGLPKRGTHVTRRTAATMLHDGGEDIATIQHVLGHADIRTTRGYTRVGAKLTAGAAKTAERELFAPVSDLDERRQRRRSG